MNLNYIDREEGTYTDTTLREYGEKEGKLKSTLKEREIMVRKRGS